ncbi:hypothetical protein ILUMI_27041 [Ignelater luminosus]|uniref:Uncharacterized protein n=1 Tax=Ignelater luminosus TaxID=2038154 RepID=A0A8K0FYK2_IGNLU|nr:hypothetical protein ILUMI_27041 [Ignelater luminosus]
MKTLDPAKNLEEMYLDNNQISVIPTRNNQLTVYEVRAMGFNRIPLSVLDLRHNKLVFLHEDFIKVAKNLLTFKVEGNLWDCDCYDRIVLLRGDLSVDLSSRYVNGEEPVCIAGISNSDNPCNIDQSNLSYYYKALEEDE